MTNLLTFYKIHIAYNLVIVTEILKPNVICLSLQQNQKFCSKSPESVKLRQISEEGRSVERQKRYVYNNLNLITSLSTSVYNNHNSSFKYISI